MTKYAKKKITPEKLARIKKDLDAGLPPELISRREDMSRTTLIKIMKRFDLQAVSYADRKRIPLTTDAKDLVLERLKAGISVTNIAAEIGFTLSTLRARILEDIDLKDLMPKSGGQKKTVHEAELDYIRKAAKFGTPLVLVAAHIGRSEEWLRLKIQDPDGNDVKDAFLDGKRLSIEKTSRLFEKVIDEAHSGERDYTSSVVATAKHWDMTRNDFAHKVEVTQPQTSIQDAGLAAKDVEKFQVLNNRQIRLLMEKKLTKQEIEGMSLHDILLHGKRLGAMTEDDFAVFVSKPAQLDQIEP